MPIKTCSKIHVSYSKLQYCCSSNVTLPLLAQAGGSTGSAQSAGRKFSRYCPEFRHTTFMKKKKKLKILGRWQSCHLLKSQLREQSSNLHDTRTLMHPLACAPAPYRVSAHAAVLTRLCHSHEKSRVRRTVFSTGN